MSEMFVKPVLVDGKARVVPKEPRVVLRRVPGEEWPRNAVPPGGCMVSDSKYIRAQIKAGVLEVAAKNAVVAVTAKAGGVATEPPGEGREVVGRGRRKAAEEE